MPTQLGEPQPVQLDQLAPDRQTDDKESISTRQQATGLRRAGERNLKLRRHPDVPSSGAVDAPTAGAAEDQPDSVPLRQSGHVRGRSPPVRDVCWIQNPAPTHAEVPPAQDSAQVTGRNVQGYARRA